MNGRKREKEREKKEREKKICEEMKL